MARPKKETKSVLQDTADRIRSAKHVLEMTEADFADAKERFTAAATAFNIAKMEAQTAERAVFSAKQNLQAELEFMSNTAISIYGDISN
jgi:hypothetical protein